MNRTPFARLLLYAATGLALVLSGYSVFAQPLPLEWSVAALVSYLVLVVLGVLVLRLRVFVDATTEGPRGATGVALTFDDGPHPVHTRRVLQILERAEAKATFFVIGRKAEAYPEVVREILSKGHSVGVHSYQHPRFFSLWGARAVRRDLERAIEVVRSISGARPRWFRPPIGHTNPIIGRVVDELGLSIVGWSFSAHDGTGLEAPERLVERARHALRDGAIVLMHDAAERDDREPVGVRALPELLKVLEEHRLDVVPLSRWMGASSEESVVE